MKLSAKEKKNLVVKESRNGKGIFAKREFIKDEVVFEVTGVFVSGDEDEDLDEQTRSNTYRYDADRYISPAGKIGDMLNHSCNPNAKVSKEGDKLLVCAVKKISVDREVTIDYSTIIAADDSWTMKCNCGSVKCRGKIVPFKRLPKELKVLYKKHNIVPKHILEI